MYILMLTLTPEFALCEFGVELIKRVAIRIRQNEFLFSGVFVVDVQVVGRPAANTFTAQKIDHHLHTFLVSPLLIFTLVRTLIFSCHWCRDGELNPALRIENPVILTDRRPRRKW